MVQPVHTSRRLSSPKLHRMLVTITIYVYYHMTNYQHDILKCFLRQIFTNDLQNSPLLTEIHTVEVLFIFLSN